MEHPRRCWCVHSGAEGIFPAGHVNDSVDPREPHTYQPPWALGDRHSGVVLAVTCQWMLVVSCQERSSAAVVCGGGGLAHALGLGLPMRIAFLWNSLSFALRDAAINKSLCAEPQS